MLFRSDYRERATEGSSPAANETGTVKVVSAPTGADIYVDGRFVGNSPAELQLSSGGHTVGAKMTGFKDWQREITVAGGAVNLNVMLVAGTNATAGVPQASTVTKTQAAPVAVPPVETPTKIDATAGKRNVPAQTGQAQAGGEGALLGVTGYLNEVGFKITSVRADSPAAQISLNPGDIISNIDGREVHSSRDIESAIAASTSGTIKVSCLIQTTAVGMVHVEREVKVR